jgi:3-hydroxybutyrate dehydrogenase
MRLDGKVALVTGAGGGIGSAIARRYAAAGAHVVIADINEKAAQAVAESIGRAGATALAMTFDVTQEPAVNAAVEAVVQRFGYIDVLVSNAGIQVVQPLEAFTLAEWRRMQAVHVEAAFLATRASLPHMYARGSGSIIYTGSTHSKTASVWKGPYVVAKHGLLGLARTVAKEGGPKGVRANVICPGFVRTPMVEVQIPELARSLGISEADVVRNVMLKDTVDGQFTTVDDVAEVALFFAAFPTNALTGQSLLVSHGWVME